MALAGIRAARTGSASSRTPKGGESWGIEHNTERMRFYVLDLLDGNTVTIVVDVRRASNFKDVIDQAAPVVESFDFSA